MRFEDLMQIGLIVVQVFLMVFYLPLFVQSVKMYSLNTLTMDWAVSSGLLSYVVVVYGIGIPVIVVLVRGWWMDKDE